MNPRMQLHQMDFVYLDSRAIALVQTPHFLGYPHQALWPQHGQLNTVVLRDLISVETPPPSQRRPSHTRTTWLLLPPQLWLPCQSAALPVHLLNHSRLHAGGIRWQDHRPQAGPPLKEILQMIHSLRLQPRISRFLTGPLGRTEVTLIQRIWIQSTHWNCQTVDPNIRTTRWPSQRRHRLRQRLRLCMSYHPRRFRLDCRGV